MIRLARRSDPPGRPEPDEPAPRPGRRGRFTPRFFDSPAMTRLGPWIGLVALCLALYLPGFTTLPPIDRDEPRFAQASREMIETGDFVQVTFQGEAREKKPAGIHWLQAAAASAFGGAAAPIQAYRLPSLLGAIGAVLLLFHLARRALGATAAFLAASLLGASLLTVFEAHLAKTDAMLLLTAVGAQGALLRIHGRAESDRSSSRGPALLFWVSIGGSILLKGPVVPMVSILTVGALWAVERSTRWWRRLDPLLGVAIVALMILPWGIAVSLETDGRFIARAVTTDLIPKLLGGQESHGAPPGTYLLLAWLTFFPGSLLVVPALLRAWRLRRDPTNRFLLAWVAPAWLVFELVPTKLPHYVLPLYPALALIVARHVLAEGTRPDEGARFRWITGCSLGLWTAVAAGVAGALVFGPLWFGLPTLAMTIPPLMILTPTIAVVAAMAWRGRVGAAAVWSIGVSAVLCGLLLPASLPGFEPIWVSANAARLVETRARGAPVAVAGYAEPSLVFLLGTRTLLTDGRGAAAFLMATPGAVALVTPEQRPGFTAALTVNGHAARPLGEIGGFNYSHGRWVTLALYGDAKP